MISIVLQIALLIYLTLCIVVSFVGMKQEARRTKNIRTLMLTIELHRRELKELNDMIREKRQVSKEDKP